MPTAFPALRHLALSGTLSLLLTPLVAAQTTPAPASTPTATPALQQPSGQAATSAATTRAVSSLAIEVSGLVRGQIVSCPAALKLSSRAVCLYVKSSTTTLRPVIKGKLNTRAIGEWSNKGKLSTLIVSETAGGRPAAFVLLSSMSDQETLLAMDAAQPRTTASKATPAAPAGIVKGEGYVLESDLIGVVSFASLGNGKFKLDSQNKQTLTVTAGQKDALTGGGAVQLPLAPVWDGRHLLFPVSGLRALGCTVTPNGNSLTVACGSASVGLRPIVF